MTVKSKCVIFKALGDAKFSNFLFRMDRLLLSMTIRWNLTVGVYIFKINPGCKFGTVGSERVKKHLSDSYLSGGQTNYLVPFRRSLWCVS